MTDNFLLRDGGHMKLTILLSVLFMSHAFAESACQNGVKIPQSKLESVLSRIEAACSKYRSDRDFEICETQRFLMYGEKTESSLILNPVEEIFEVTMFDKGELVFRSEMEMIVVEGEVNDHAYTFLSTDKQNISIQTRLFAQRDRKKPMDATVLVPDIGLYFFQNCIIDL